MNRALKGLVTIGASIPRYESAVNGQTGCRLPACNRELIEGQEIRDGVNGAYPVERVTRLQATNTPRN
jgi:hypothetical protein